MKMALGTSSYRSGFGHSESQDLTKKIFATNLEKVSAGLDGMGGGSRWTPRRKRGGVKSVLPPSPAILGETAGCGDFLRASSTTPFSKESGGTRSIAVPNGNKLEDWAIRSGEPKCVIEKHMVPVQRSQGCRSQMRDYSSRCGLRYDPALCESTGVY